MRVGELVARRIRRVMAIGRHRPPARSKVVVSVGVVEGFRPIGVNLEAIANAMAVGDGVQTSLVISASPAGEVPVGKSGIGRRR